MAAEFNPAAVPASRYPPGYRFVPTDLELVRDYLAKKIKNERLPISDIYEVNLYQYNPETLAENYPKLGENEWYFFTPRNRKYKNGSRPNRAAGTGYWKATGADKDILCEDKRSIVGYKKTLVFYQGKSPNGDKTGWIMHEFRVLDQSPKSKRNADDIMKLDNWVLCRIYQKYTKAGENHKSQAKSSTFVDQNNPSESIEVDVSEVTNSDNLAQLSNIQDNIEVGNNNNNDNNLNFNPMVIHDNNTTQVATTNNVNPRFQDDPTFFKDMDWLFKHFADFPDDPPVRNALRQNVSEASSPLINLGFDSGPSFFDLDGWGIQQQGDVQVQKGSCGLQNFNNFSQTGPSNFGPPSRNLNDSELTVEDYEKEGLVIYKIPDHS